MQKKNPTPGNKKGSEQKAWEHLETITQRINVATGGQVRWISNEVTESGEVFECAGKSGPQQPCIKCWETESMGQAGECGTFIYNKIYFCMQIKYQTSAAKYFN